MTIPEIRNALNELSNTQEKMSREINEITQSLGLLREQLGLQMPNPNAVPASAIVGSGGGKSARY